MGNQALVQSYLGVFATRAVGDLQIELALPLRVHRAWRSSNSRSQRMASHCGDTLWSIAAHRLGSKATSADIDAEWHRWFAANRKVIGADANAIEPGQLLSPPAPLQVSS